MAARPLDVAPSGPLALPDAGLGRGWEPAVLLGTTLLLLSVGLVTLYSASNVLAVNQGYTDSYYVLRQAMGAAVGLVALVVCYRMPYSVWWYAAWPMVIVSSIALFVLILPWTHGIAPEINGARRWLDVGVTIQPSEFAKIAVIVWTAMLAVKKHDEFKRLSKGLAPFLVVWGAILLLVVVEDLSTAFVIGSVAVMTVFAAGARIGHFIFLGVAAAPLMYVQLGVGFRVQRLMSFLSPEADPTGAGYQVTQSLIAIGSGGIAGQGFGEGRQKFGFIPEPHNDFIFAMIGEEWGLIGVLFLISIYLVFVLVGFRIARRAPDFFGQLLAVGLTNLIAIQAVLHMGVGLGLVPPTGLALPLVSYGRSNLLVTLVAIGMLMSIARTCDTPQLARSRYA